MITELKKTLRETNPTTKELRLFGLILTGILSLMIYAREWHASFYAIPIIIGVASIISPTFIRYPHRLLFAITLPIGFIVSRIILSAVFYLIITPIAILMRLVGQRPIELGFEKSKATYWESIDER